MPTLESAHDHPISGPVVIIHSKGPQVDGVRVENPSHAFGPFASEDDARRWDAAGADDCYRLIVDLFDPWEMDGR